jgi:endonuclease G
MKKILTCLFIIIANYAFSQKDIVVVKNEIYKIVYSQYLEQPVKVEYIVLCPNGQASRKGMDFYKNDTIKTSDDLDYEKNLYDKGHMAPAADFNCTKEMLFKTFSYLNCALQDQNLNRGVWKELEAYERNLAGKQKVYVEIICVFSDKSTKLKSGATVPDGFYKNIKYGKSLEKYYFPNTKPNKAKYSEYMIK